MRTIRTLSLAAAVVLLFAAMQGRLARVAGAGTACPDWPLCYGQVIPAMDLPIFLEWLHRFFVLTTTVLLIAVVILAWRQGGVARRFGVLCLGLLLATAALGGISILTPLHPLLAALDQGLAMLTFASLVGFTLWCYWTDAPEVPRLVREQG